MKMWDRFKQTNKVCFFFGHVWERGPWNTERCEYCGIKRKKSK